MKRIVFRADASVTIGSGHVMRCVTLAKELQERGFSPSFICREHIGHLCDFIEAQGFVVVRLPMGQLSRMRGISLAHEQWLGADWEEDAAACIQAIERLAPTPQWLVVDHYALDVRWEDAMRRVVGGILAIDDLADRTHSASLLLDQNLVASMESRYHGKVSSDCVSLLGPVYALLQPDYAQLHVDALPRSGRVERILVYFGASDEHDLTGRAIDAIQRIGGPAIRVDVVVGPHADAVRRQVVGHDYIHLHSSLPSLAPLMATADLAIGASGSSSWERLCLGLPSIVISVAGNQRQIAEELATLGLVRYLGHHNTVSTLDIEAALREVLDLGLPEEWSIKCLAAVDGLGCARVGDQLESLGKPALRARRAGLEDESLLLAWANDATTRGNAFSPDAISESTHARWFRDRLGEVESCVFYILMNAENEPVGTVRFQREGQKWEVHFTVSPQFRGSGLGRPVLSEGLCQLRREIVAAKTVIGRVKVSNQPSQRIFEGLGFAMEIAPGDDVILYRLEV